MLNHGTILFQGDRKEITDRHQLVTGEDYKCSLINQDKVIYKEKGQFATKLLSPLSKEDRKAYLEKAYLVRCALAFILFFIGNSILLVLNKIGIWQVIIIFYGFTLYTMTVNYYVADTGKSPYRKEKQLIKKNEKFKGYTGCMVTAQMVFYLIIRFRYRKRIFEIGTNYEDCY